MALAGIPHPLALSTAQANPSSYGVGESQLRDYFEKLIPALATDPNDRQQLFAQTNGNMGRWKSDWTLSDMKGGIANVVVSNLEELVNQAASEDWYYQVCPRFETKDLNFQVINVFFQPTVAQEAAPRVAPRQLDIQKTANQVGLTRFIHGFQLDTETLFAGVQDGVKWFTERVYMMQLGIMETDKMIIITGIMNMHKAQLVRINDYMSHLRSLGGVRQGVLRENEITFCMLKQKDPIRFIREISNTDFTFLGVPTNNLVTLMHEHTARLLISNDYYRTASEGNQFDILDRRSAVADILGAGIHFVRNFRDKNGQPINPIGSIFNCAEYYPLIDPHMDCPDQPYKTEYRNAKISSDEGSLLMIQFLEAVERTGRWDMVTGELLSLNDADAWAVANEAMRKKIGANAASDALHIDIESAEFDQSPYIGPALFWGSVKNSTISTEMFLNCAKSVVADIAEAEVVEAALDEFVALVGEAGNRPIADIRAHLTRAGGPAADFRNVGMVGCRSSNPTLKFHTASPGTGFPAAGYGVIPGGAITEMPAGFGSLAAMRYLVGIAAEPLKSRLTKVINGAASLAAALKNRFASSVLIDPNYASTDLQYATAADMLFSTALLPRRAVAMVKTAGGGAALAAAVKNLVDANTAYYAGTGKDVSALVAAQAAAAGVADANKLTKIALLTLALRSFAKDRITGQFSVDPTPVIGTGVDGGETIAKFTTDLVEATRTAATGAAKGAMLRTPAQLKGALDELATELAALGAATGSQYVMTKLYLEPSQILELATVGTAAAGFTIGREDRHDYPADDAQLRTYADSIRRSANANVAFGMPLRARWPLTSSGALSAVHSIRQLRAYMAENGYPMPPRSVHRRAETSLRPASGYSSTPGSDRRARLMQNLYSSGPAALASPLSSSAAASPASASDPTGIARELFSCVDHRLDLMFTSSFAANWDGINVRASSMLELIVARLYLTTPTNYYKSVALWATNNVRLPFSVAILRNIRVQTNPVIRMVPGANTCRLANGFRRTLSGTDQVAGIFGMINSYYAGFIPVTPKNVQIYNNVDTAGYRGGLGRNWHDFKRNEPGMIAVFMPGNRMPMAISPFGSIEPVASAINAPEAFSTGTESIAAFEQFRQGRMNSPWPTEERVGLHPEMGRPFENLLTRYYSRGAVMFAGVGCTFQKHVTSMSPIPTEWLGSDLRHILDGLKNGPSDPLRLGANNQLALHSF